jgi:hypothetical protein
MPHQTRNALSQGVVEAFDVIRSASFLCNGFMLGWWNHALVGFVLIRMERGLLEEDHRLMDAILAQYGREGFLKAWLAAQGFPDALSRYTNGILAHSSLALSRLRSPT